MSETISEDTQARICPILFMYKNPLARFGESIVLDDDTICAATCEGIKTEARAIGALTLPRIFDRVYCEKTE
ncbi:MAG TPA: hypothetical protein VNE40_02370 [Candidatus Dormibacteraeota bacterium]|nr:hypothetical protein [Candidatus Dormibacteraeota bacterium]